MRSYTESDVPIAVRAAHVEAPWVRKNFRVGICSWGRRKYRIPAPYLDTAQHSVGHGDPEKLTIPVGIRAEHLVDGVRHERWLAHATFPLVVVAKKCEHAA